MEPHSRPCFTHHGTLRFPQALVLLLSTCRAGPTTDPVPQAGPDPAICRNINNCADRLLLSIPVPVDVGLSKLILVGMQVTALCGLGSVLWLWSRRNRKEAALASGHEDTDEADDANVTDPGLLRKHSTSRSYTVPGTSFTYPAIRTFFRPHPQGDKLPREPYSIPLLVFIHGLGGSIAQFNPILLSLSNLAPCLAIDLPGCGLSTFEPKRWDAYTTEALVQLLAVAIDAHRAVGEDQPVILVGHSMGCSLAALLASPSSPYVHLLSEHVRGVVAICPQADPPTKEQVGKLRKLTSIPAGVFDLFRNWDRRGALNSPSVLRMTGAGADEETKRLQLRFNKQSRSAVWQRMARGMCPDYSTGFSKGGLPGREVWGGLNVPVFLAAGESDHVTPAENVKRIVEFLGRDVSGVEPLSEKASIPIAATPFDPDIVLPDDARKHHDSGIDANDLPNDFDSNTTHSLPNSSTQVSFERADVEVIDTKTALADGPLLASNSPTSASIPTPHPRRLIVKIAILPTPAAHALLFAPSTSRILSGLIGNFLASHTDPRLSLAWQLQYLSTEGKWDVKNLAKWRAVPPVSAPIAHTFRAMKTLREVDETHTPKVLAATYKKEISAVIDISHDAPVYDPAGLEAQGIPYYKFPTVSKQPPLASEVSAFIALVDRILSEKRPGLVAVHCHYGFNRTGFFVVSYLVERLGYGIEEALGEFAERRKPGIRHCHFVDALWVRYAKGLRRAPTL